jgi:hypothetical protein
MKYATEMGSGAVIYILRFIKIGSGTQKLMRGYADTQHRDHISLLSFFQYKESRLKKVKKWRVQQLVRK